MLTRALLPLTLALAACAPVQADTQRRPALAASGAPGMVSAADPRAAEAGAEMLRAGGSATDAALATMVALTVVEPQSSGIGGGGFLVHHDAAAGRLTTIDGRETAPRAATPSLFVGPNGTALPFREAVPGGKSVGVPGNIRLMELAHGRHGRLAWSRLFQPAIRLARDGFEITPRLHDFLDPELRDNMDAAGRAMFFQADGSPKPVGTRVRNPELAAFLERLARNGPQAFYAGENASQLVQTVRTAARNPSQMTVADMRGYRAVEREPVCGAYRGHRICGMGPPSSGAIAVFAILKQLERFDMRALGPDNPQAWHLIAESMRLAYADRDAYPADPDFVRVPTQGLTSDAYLGQRSQLIAPDRRMASAAPGTPPGATQVTIAPAREVPSTSHFVATDRAGNVVSYTSTIEGPFGSGLTVNGYFLNNELTDFSFAAERNGAPVANRVEGGKRPRSSMSPSIVYGPDGQVRLAVGAAGGPTIIAQTAIAILGVVDWNLSAQDALALPRIVAIGDRLQVEDNPRLQAMLPALQALGHRPTVTRAIGKANAIEWTGGRWVGAADPRSEGRAVSE